MLLLLLRHGIAEDLSELVTKDSNRALTPEGRIRTRRAMSGLSEIVPSIDFVATSPKVRAKQTAQLLREAYGTLCPNPKIWDELADCDDFAVLTRKLAALNAETVVLVGHEPDLSLLAAHLLAGESSLHMNFKKAGVCAIQVDWHSGAAYLEFFMQPKALRKLAGLSE
jgi:phosphohistidine phosphatase